MSTRFLADDPRDGSAEVPDELNRDSYVHHMVGILKSASDQSPSSVLALIGEWGSGKTSLLRQFSTALKNAGWSIGTFDPWAYPDAESIQTGFFVDLYKALPSSVKSKNLRSSIGRTARKLAPFGSITQLIGLDSEKLIEAAAQWLQQEESLQDLVDKVAADLEKAAIPTLMVLDDLDRLTPEELLVVFKLVRHIGRLPHVYYLLSYDERTLLDVLATTPLAAGTSATLGHTRAAQYLEKVVQVRLDMPMLRGPERWKLLRSGLGEVLHSLEITMTSSEEVRFTQMFTQVLRSEFTTPRSIYRYLGQLDASFTRLKGEVDLIDFMLLTWIRTVEPGSYRMIQTSRETLLGLLHHPWVAMKDKVKAQAERKAFWDGKLRDAGLSGDRAETVVKALGLMFPEFSEVYAYASRYEYHPRGISSRYYFDRYFIFGVPADDISDSTFEAALADLRHDGGPDFNTTNVSMLKEAIERDPLLVLDKVDKMRAPLDTLPNYGLAKILGETKVDDSGDAMYADSAVRFLENEVAKCLVRLSDREVDRLLLGNLVNPMQVDALLASGVRRVFWESEKTSSFIFPGEQPRNVEYLLDAARKELRRVFSDRNSSHVFTASEAVAYTTWADLDFDKAADWLHGAVGTGVMTLTDAIVSLVVPQRKDSDSGVVMVSAYMVPTVATSRFDRETLLASVAAGDGTAFDWPYTYEGRLNFAARTLREMGPTG